jgi:hypothetical protein
MTVMPIRKGNDRKLDSAVMRERNHQDGDTRKANKQPTYLRCSDMGAKQPLDM